MPRKPKPKTLRPVHPNRGIEAMYRKRLNAEIEAMQKSVVYWLKATYRKNEPRIAQDESPADMLRRTMKDLSKRWNKRFDTMAKKLAAHFAQSVETRSSLALRKILKDGGFAVEFRMTPAMRDVMDATIAENVALIKSIPSQYLTQVEGIVMRGAQTGRDAGQIAQDLRERLGVTKRRAAFIARDQVEKSTASFNRARFLEVGIEQAVWVHSGGGMSKRPSHVKAGRDGVVYDVSKGWYDPDAKEWIQPGYLPNCKCVGRPVLPGIS
ncbi:MAG: hypothetical protein PF483_05990 [Halothiobacillus sp.]|jgi:uncharacterized protein with gpF-like domain|nr:hypothetical protein [Halothiobacillus sp.]